MSYEHFNYELPNKISFYESLLVWLQHKQESDLLQIFKGGKCSFNSTGSFSRIRWNAHGLSIYFHIPTMNFDKLTESIEPKMIEFCNQIIPKENGFDITSIHFQPLISKPIEVKSLMKDFDETIESSSQIIKQILPEDIKQKGKEMTECYLYLYCVENTLRLFIETTSKTVFGKKYFESLNLNNSIKEKLTSRKKEEQINKWKRFRGNNDIFYLDFKDLSTIIRNNWNLFSKYFPNQPWIETKINELAECRNLIAHNSYLGEHEKDVIRINFNSILKQLEKIPT